MDRLERGVVMRSLWNKCAANSRVVCGAERALPAAGVWGGGERETKQPNREWTRMDANYFGAGGAEGAEGGGGAWGERKIVSLNCKNMIKVFS